MKKSSSTHNWYTNNWHVCPETLISNTRSNIDDSEAWCAHSDDTPGTRRWKHTSCLFTICCGVIQCAKNINQGFRAQMFPLNLCHNKSWKGSDTWMGRSQHSTWCPLYIRTSWWDYLRGVTSTHSLCKIPSGQYYACAFFCARKTVPCASYHRRDNPCHARMMLPLTYWALVESILYSSWYLDAAHMDTDRA